MDLLQEDHDWVCECECHKSEHAKVDHANPCCTICWRCKTRVKIGRSYEQKHAAFCLQVPSIRGISSFGRDSLMPPAPEDDSDESSLDMEQSPDSHISFSSNDDNPFVRVIMPDKK